MRRLITGILLVAFTVTGLGVMPEAMAQTMINLPAPGTLVQLSSGYNPLQLKGIRVNPSKPLQFDFILDKGQGQMSPSLMRAEVERLSKYFLTALTIPDHELWVNLSPYEKERIAADSFGQTQMGKDLLEQDYLLKQVASSMLYPEEPLGQEFWRTVYGLAKQEFQTTQIPVKAYHKVWIVPKSATVLVRNGMAYVSESVLEAMLDSDYLAMSKNAIPAFSKYQTLYMNAFKQIVLPRLRKEINEGKNFAVVRQAYGAMILAAWYKKHLKESFLSRAYVRQSKIRGIAVDDPGVKEKIYQQYLQSFRKNVFSYIREEIDPVSGESVARKYVSGGFDFTTFANTGSIYQERVWESPYLAAAGNMAMASVDILPQRPVEKLAGVIKALRRHAAPVAASVLLGVAGMTLSMPSFAEVIPASDGTVTVTIKEGKTFSHAVEEIRVSMNKHDRAAYDRSAYSGKMWGEGGVMSRFNAPAVVNPGQAITFEVPRSFVKALKESGVTPAAQAAQSLPAAIVKQAPLSSQQDLRPVQAAASASLGASAPVDIPIVVDGKPQEGLTIPSISQETLFDAGVALSLAALLGAGALGARKIVVSRRKKPASQKSDVPVLKKQPLPMVIQTSDDDRPAPVTPAEQQFGKRADRKTPIVEGPASSAPAALSQKEQDPSYAQAMKDKLAALAEQPAVVPMRPVGFWENIWDKVLIKSIIGMTFVSLAWDKIVENISLPGPGTLACGIILFGRVDKPKGLAAKGDKKFLGMMSKAFKILSSRGIHSAGLWTVRKNPQGKLQSVLAKRMKGKRIGRNIVDDLFADFSKELPPIDPKVYKSDDYVLDVVFGHSRWATGGKVTIKATHPHLGAVPNKIVWTVREGKLLPDTMEDVEVGIGDLTDKEQEQLKVSLYDGLGHNGDNDFYRFKDTEEYLNVAQARALFVNLVHYQGSLPPGDSPLLALQIHYHLTMGVWSSAVRFAHVETHLKTTDERMEESLTEEQENRLGAAFDAVFGKYAPLLSRPGLEKPNKTFKDLWVDERALSQEPQLSMQHDIIKAFKAEMGENIKAMVKAHALPQGLVQHLNRGSDLEENIRHFVDAATERFFTGDRRKANQEVMSRVKGTYGYYSYTSLEPNGFTVVSRQQPAIFGYNMETGAIGVASSPDPLMVKDDDGNGFKELFYLDDKGDGEMMDVNIAPATGAFHLRFLELATGKDTPQEDRQHRTFTLDERNPYFTPAEEEIDESKRIINDIHTITPQLADAQAQWEDPRSFNRQSNALMLQKLAAVYILRSMKEHARYGSVFQITQNKTRALLKQCGASANCSEGQMDLLRQESAPGLARSSSLLMVMVDEQLKQKANSLAAQLSAKALNAQTVWEGMGQDIEEAAESVLSRLTPAGLEGLYTQWEQEKQRSFLRQDKEGADFVAAAYSDTYYISKVVFEGIFTTLLPGLKARVENTNDILDPANKLGLNIYDIGVALVASKYGGTFPTSIALDKLNAAIGQDNVFVMVGKMHSTMSVKAGQSLNAGAPFSQRVYVTGNMSRSEAGSISEVMLKAHQVQMAFGLVEGLRELFPGDKPFGLEASQEDIRHDKQLLLQSMMDDARHITGTDEEGKVFKSAVLQNKDAIGNDVTGDVNKRLRQRGLRYAKHFLDGTFTQGLFWFYVVGVLPVWGGIVSWMIGSQAYGFRVAENIATLLLGGIGIPLLYRAVMGLPLGARFGPPPSILPVSPFAQVQDMFLSKLMAQAPKTQASPIHGATQRDAMALLTPKIQRGSWVEGHFPADDQNRGDFSRVIMQLKTSKFEVPWLFGKRQGALGYTTSRTVINDPDRNITDDNVVIGGGEVYGKIRDPKFREVYNAVIDPFGGWLAQKVAYGYAYQKVTFGAKTFDPANTTFNTRSHTTEVGQSDRKFKARPEADAAMTKGGIDLDPAKMTLNIKGDLAPVSGVLPQTVFPDYVIEGIVPRVNAIVPMTPELVKEWVGV